jgi:serine/threonine protein kinase/Tfp pilus assembly protein PilF
MNHPSSLEAVFFAALEKTSPGQRAAYLDEACAGDFDLRKRVEKMLAAQALAGSFLEQPAAALPSPLGGERSAVRGIATVDEPIAEQPGTVIGPYKLLEQIGEGGFGVVFMAEQQQPIRRKVALKILKPGMDTRQVIARFEAERQALALMDHPNIAKVLDGGATAGGRPYFVMDLVKGIPITEFCDQNQVPIRQRLELFLSVCQAVQHAHQKGIIHRDIKPSNVLVMSNDGTPLVKVIDFGVAKAMGQELTDKTLFTGFAQMIGTPLYMSPEQAGQSSLDVDTRSDIYSLGVLLYELLTGTTPFDKERLRTAGYDEIRRIIREEEPPKPSTRISTLGQASTAISTQRKSDPKALSQLCRRELDWIVMRALEKDRNRRYETASAFAADVQRYLNDESVMACPPSARYLFWKFARRKKRALAMTACVSLALAGMAAGAGWVTRDRAARAAALDATVNRDLDQAEELLHEGNWSGALTAVQRALNFLRAADRTKSPPRLLELERDAAMAQRLEAIYSQPRTQPPRVDDMSKPPTAADMSRIDDFFTGKEQDADYGEAFRDYGIDLSSLGLTEAAEHIQGRSIRPDLARALDFWSFARRRAGTAGPPDWKQLLELAEAADPNDRRNQLRRALRQEDSVTQKSLATGADVRQLPPETLVQLGCTLGDSLKTPEQAVILLRQAQRQYPADLWINNALGWYCYKLKQYDDSARFFSVASAIYPSSPYLVYDVGLALWAKGCHPEAVAHYAKAVDLKPDYIRARTDLCITLWKLDRLPEAEAVCRETIRLKPNDAELRFTLGSLLSRQRHFAEAEASFREAISLQPESIGARAALGELLLSLDKFPEAEAIYREILHLQPDKAWHHVRLGLLLERQGRLGEAEAAFREAIRHDPAYGGAHLGSLHQRQGKLAEAEAAYREVIRRKPDYAEAHRALCGMLRSQGQLAAAEAACREWIHFRPDDPSAHEELGTILGSQDKLPEATAAYREALHLQPENAGLHYSLGVLLASQGKLAEAEAAYRDTIRLQPEQSTNHLRLGEVLQDQGKLVEAEAAYREAIRRRPNNSAALYRLGWLLATGPDPKRRNPEEALSLAERAVKLVSNVGVFWRTLGVARYRTGDYQGAISALEKALGLQKRASVEWFFLAMAHWQLGEKDQARQRYDRVAQWMEKNQAELAADKQGGEELRRFRSEAAELLGIKDEKPNHQNTKDTKVKP